MSREAKLVQAKVWMAHVAVLYATGSARCRMMRSRGTVGLVQGRRRR